MKSEDIKAIAKTVRCLTMDAIQKANSGHPGMPMGTAELGAMLYGEFLKHDPELPEWLDRDRFVLSAGHGSMFLYSMLHLSGYPVSMDDIRSFRQLGSKCAGHPEHGYIPGIETTTGPLGQGIANAVGMAIAETMLAARFNTDAHSIIDHYTWCLSGDGCLQEGVALEAISLAGHLGLGKLILFYDDNKITIDGGTELSFTEDVAARFAACHWHVQKGDMYDAEALRKMVAEAKGEASRPSIIMLRSEIGRGSPSLAGSAKTHGAPLGHEEIAKAKAAMGVAVDAEFYVDPLASAFFAERKTELVSERKAWEARFDAWKKAEPGLASELEAALAGRPLTEAELPVFTAEDSQPTRAASGSVLQAISKAWPQLVGGSADLTGPNASQLGGEPYSKEHRAGRMIHFGIREHAMAAISNGIALHGGLRPFCATFLVFSDYLRPALRLSALMKLPVIYIFTHDSVYVGEDGPTHQPVEHLAALRLIPNLLVLRPADAEETAEAWKWAMERQDGPTALILSRQRLPVISKADPYWKETMRTGAYVVKTTAKEAETVVIASGSEVELAIEAAGKQKTDTTRVVSVISLETFLNQPEAIKKAMIPEGTRVVSCEAGRTFGWDGLADASLGIDRFGESAPGGVVAKHLGFSVDNLLSILEAGDK